MGGISTLEYEKWENVTPDGKSCTKEEAEGRANWLSFVRDKEAGTFSLSVRDNNPQKGDHVKHYRIQMHEGNGFIINKQSVFPMLLWRARHYQMNSDGLCCILTKACPQEEPNTIGLGKDRWEYLRMTTQLEHGQFGEVWQGVWNGNTLVAVKTLKEGTSAEFLVEANVMKRVGHERLVQPYAVCLDREPIYIVTELMPNGSLLDYLKDGMGKDTMLTTHVDRGAQITMAKKSNVKECDKVPPDDSGMVKERPKEAAIETTTQLCPLKKEEELKETEKHAASGEQNTSLPPASNNKTCSNKYPVMKHIYKWMLLIYLLFGTTTTVSAKVDVQREDWRSLTIANSETEVATYSVPTPVDGANYLIYAKDGNKPGSFICTPEFVEVNKICTLEVGDKNKTECEGLQIFRNDTHTHLTVDGSTLTHDCTAFCILQNFPRLYTLYPLAVCKEHDQDVNECASNPCQNGGACEDGLDSYACNCAKGYDGANCEIDINECASNPCKNGGMCVDGLDSYTCNCTKGYNGANCEIDVNECASNPCQNGGACEDGLDSYACNCAKGCDGANCEIDNENPVISGCPSDQSVNTGSGNATDLVTWTPPTATDNSGTQTLTSSHNPGDSFPIGNNTVTYTSRDAAGNTDTCTFLIAVADINECASNPCQNGGACVDGLDSYTCYCAKGYDGANCEIAPKTTDWKLAFVIVVPFLIILCAIIAIRERLTSIKLRSKSTKQVHKNGTEMRHRQNCQSVRFSRISFEV